MTSWALLGSGEFEPWSEVADRFLLETSSGDGRVVILPTASSLEGDDVFDGWGTRGLEHFAALGVPAEVLPVRSREDAGRADLAERLDGASTVYLSGGNPSHLADVLRDTVVWAAIVDGLARGMGYAGCSAGVACLTETTYDSDSDDLNSIFKPGLGLVRRTLFGPHWDIVDTWVPGASRSIVSSVAPGDVFVGIDEETAMLGDGRGWRVSGRGSVHVHVDGSFVHHRDGARFELPLTIGV
ncbi:MAG TPA: Type 1 glutamine amidotransferase-like domain-containing protein [Actinomycetota bacterium]|nr:Type 1 glutamine amidotransferase-like domain-containing protein [Actinomycetota bacterium]